MNTCYKCGKDLESGAECEPDCASTAQPTDAQVLKILEAFRRQQVPIDWDKVITPEDMLLVIKTIFHGASVLRGTEPYEKLKRFLKEKPSHE